jgi:hypothetical protein
MGRTWIRQDAQIASTLHSDVGFLDNIAPTQASYETNATDIANDLNNVRSQLQNFLNRDGGGFPIGDWWNDLIAPTTFENGSARGINSQNQQLHDLERKRVLVSVSSLVDVTVPNAQNYVVLASGELPSNKTAATGDPSTTLGTIGAYNVGFNAHSLAEIAGATAIGPKNLCEIVDGATRDPILSGGRVVYALFQTETLTDPHTMTGITPKRAQLSFVRINAAGDDLEAAPVTDIQNKIINYASVERKALESLNEEDFLRGAIVDVPAGTTVTRQVGYDNQSSTPVDVSGYNAILDIESTGNFWQIRDEDEASLLKLVTNSGTSATTIEVGAAVDYFDVNAVDNNFSAGVHVRTGGTRSIDIGVTDGVIETTAGALELLAKTVLSFDDQYSPVGWSLTEGVHLSDAGQEWTDFESNFGGEVSLMNAINQAYKKQKRSKVQAIVTSNVPVNTDVNGPAGAGNLDVNLLPYNSVPVGFVQNVEIYLNGELLRNNSISGAEDVYPGSSSLIGDLRFTFKLLSTGAKPDQITMIVNGQ